MYVAKINCEEGKMLSAKVIADFYIWKSAKENKPITNKKLQKLLYYSQAWYLVLKDKPLFSEEIEAWVHGPTVRDVYFAFKDCGFAPIKKSVSEAIVDKVKDQKSFLESIWNVYGKFDADYLEELTHNEEPWQKARAGLDAHMASENIVSADSMKEYYSKKLKEAKKDKNATSS